MKLKVVELFAGVGGFRVGLNNVKTVNTETGRAIETGNWDFVWANQYEPATKIQHAFECYTTRFGGKACSNENIHNVDKRTIPDHTLLVGGFPCQDYSVARSLSNEKGIEGKKGVLFWDIRDVLDAKKTPFVLLENVDRLLKSPASMRGRDFAIMLSTFDSLNYDVCWRVINAGEYGMPQKRRRVFIFAFKRDTKYGKWFKHEDEKGLLYSNLLNKTFPIKENSYTMSQTNLNKYKDIVDVSGNYHNGKFLNFGFMKNGVVHHVDVESEAEALYPLQSLIENAEKFNPQDKNPYVVEDAKLDKWRYLKGSKKVKRVSKTGHEYFYTEGQMSFPDNLNAPARTMLTSEGSINRSSHIIFDSHINQYRILTPVECEMIQMFPPHWTNHKVMTQRKRYFMMGNALVTGIVNRLELNLKTIIQAE